MGVRYPLLLQKLLGEERSTLREGRAAAWLRVCARISYGRYRVPVVAITGSVGKTTAKEWIADVLQSTFTVVRTPANLNIRGIATTLLGIPFSTGVRPFVRRLGPILRSTLISPPRPDYFVLEVATTRTGDIPNALTMFTPTISVVTTIAPSHLDGLGSMQGVIREKSRLVAALPESGYAVIRYDDEIVREMAHLNRGRTIFYGFAPDADVWMDPPIRSSGGLSTTLHDDEGQVALCFANLLNQYHLYAVMAAWCVGKIAGVPRDRMAALVQQFSPVDGRGRLVPGPRGSLLLDESWNANPASMLAAFETFHAVVGDRRRIMILGDMLELGSDADSLHQEIGREAAAYTDVLIGIGERAQSYVEEYRRLRPSQPAYYRRTVGEAVELIDRELQPGDAVLLKASHGVHLDKLAAGIQKLS